MVKQYFAQLNWMNWTLKLLKIIKGKPSNQVRHISEEILEGLDDRYKIKLINSLSGAKSANLIGTVSNNGQENVSIVSSVFHLGASPALMGFIIRPDSTPRDTLNNIRENGSFTINHVNEKIMIKSHQTSARYESNISEFKECGLTPEYLKDHKAPYVKESHIKVALKLIREEKLIENGTHLIIAKITNIITPENIIEKDGHLNIQKAGSLAVTGLDEYQSLFSYGRLSYAKNNKPLTWLS
jgi:flavin reductase (DIM6/NTAB) family NADH-FMN oxidoreductase RutF